MNRSLTSYRLRAPESFIWDLRNGLLSDAIDRRFDKKPISRAVVTPEFGLLPFSV